MKNFTFFLVFLLVAFLSIATMAQSPWIPQRASGLPNSVNPAVRFFALDENVCWGISSNNPLYLRTINGGTNWTVATITGAAGGSASITALDANTAWVCISGGVFKTTDGGLTWDKQLTAFQGFSGHPDVIHFFDSNNGVCAGDPNNGYWAIYTTTDGGTNWVRVPSGNIPPPVPTGELGISSVAITSGNSFWFGTFDGSLYRSTDRGMTWTVARNVVGDFDGFGYAFKDSLNGLACTFVTSKKISKTSDGGLTWTRILPLPSGLSGLSPFYVNYAKGSEGSYVITSHNNIGGFVQAIPGSAYSNDDGETWIQVDNLPHGPTSFSSWDIGWSAGVNDSVYKWDSDILPVELTSFTAQAQNQVVILKWVTATEINNHGFEIQRKFVKGDFVTVGFKKGEGTTTNQIEYSYVDKNLVDGKYFYRLKQVDFNGAYEYSNTIEVDVRSLDNFTLEQNYPNPFNPTTTIGYVLQEKSSTKLTLMNAIGEEVAVLVNEEQDKGYHKVDLNARDLPSGVYLYRLQAGSFFETRKMLLLK
jgi:photosystem II stability/assembly factor-like uncharacterized protein